MQTITSEQIKELLPKRPKDSHKGTFGKVLVIAGSEKYPGAAVLCARSVYRVGAGLVTITAPKDLIPIYVKELPEATHLELGQIFNVVDKYDSVLVGPGLGNVSLDFYNNLFPPRGWDKLVLDADGLNGLVKIEKWWEKLNGQVVLTPHPGEMSGLTGLSVEEIQKDKVGVAQKYAKEWGKVVVLKGAETVIASPDNVAISPFANPALATAGTGDILAGAIAGFLAQGLSGFDAAQVGVYVHGLAGELWSKKHGYTGMLASDLIELLPEAIKEIKV